MRVSIFNFKIALCALGVKDLELAYMHREFVGIYMEHVGFTC